MWGDLACFTDPASKVERRSYPVPTPTAARGKLTALYSTPPEFYWQVKRIEVLSRIRYISFKRKEVKATVKEARVFDDEDRARRQAQALRDVRYRITAEICPQPDFRGTVEQLYSQALRRIRGGKTFYQPSLGLREFVAYFEESDGTRQPIPESMDLGLMVYDVFDLHDYSVRKKTKPCLSLYHAKMENGVIEVPPYDSPEVLKGGTPC